MYKTINIGYHRDWKHVFGTNLESLSICKYIVWVFNSGKDFQRDEQLQSLLKPLMFHLIFHGNKTGSTILTLAWEFYSRFKLIIPHFHRSTCVLIYYYIIQETEHSSNCFHLLSTFLFITLVWLMLHLYNLGMTDASSL